jgi:hypothetical protein
MVRQLPCDKGYGNCESIRHRVTVLPQCTLIGSGYSYIVPVMRRRPLNAPDWCDSCSLEKATPVNHTVMHSGATALEITDLSRWGG